MKHQKNLNRFDLVSMSVGMIIGVGIMTMTGIAIGYTGRSVNIAYILAAVIILISAVPQILIGGTVSLPGGQYTQIAILGGKTFSGIFAFIYLAVIVSLSMYALSFSDYCLTVMPMGNKSVISFITLTVIFTIHILGVKQAARLQNIMCIVLLSCIILYIIFGIDEVKTGYFSGEEFMVNGISGLLLATVFLTFSIEGATFVVNYCDVAERPTKDIPFAIVVATIGVAILYTLVASVASGVLPIDKVANQPLSVSAAVFLPTGLFVLFVIGGAMFSLLTTLNFIVGMLTFPLMRACEDGWLPKQLTMRNSRFGTPHRLLLAMYIISVTPIVFNINLDTIANSTVILTICIRGVISYSAMKLPEKMPETWKKSKFHVSNHILKAVCITSIALSVLSVGMLIISSSKVEIMGNLIILVLVIVFTLLRRRHVNSKP